MFCGDIQVEYMYECQECVDRDMFYHVKRGLNDVSRCAVAEMSAVSPMAGSPFLSMD